MDKKCIFYIFVLLFTTGIHQHLPAQSFSLGGGLAFGSLIENAGINFRGFYNIDEKVRVGSDFTLFFPRNYPYYEGYYRRTAWELNFNGNYLVDIGNNFQVYPLFGLNVTGIKRTYDYDIIYSNLWGIIFRESYYYIQKGTNIGVNLGGGLQYKINSLSPFFEFKYIISRFDQAVMNLGLLYTFE